MNILYVILGLASMICVHGLVDWEADEEVNLDERIIGGIQVNISDYPYMVSISRENVSVCAAVLIGTKWVATSAQCVDAYKNTPSELLVRVGSTKKKSGGETVKVVQVLSHPRFTASPLDYDLALLELAPALVVTDNIKPVNLPEAYTPLPVGQNGWVSGWGASKTQNQTNVLNAAEVQFMDEVTSKNYYPDLITGTMFCADTFGSYHGACVGDNGGPIVRLGVVYGILSHAEGCGLSDHPPVYVSVADLMDFIEDTISNNE